MQDLPQSSHPSGFQQQRLARQWPFNPSHCESSQDMSMRHDQNVTTRMDSTFQVFHRGSMISGLDFTDQSIEALCNLFGRPVPRLEPFSRRRLSSDILASWTSIPPDIPCTKARSLPLRSNLLGCNPLIFPVIPLSNVLRHRHFCIRTFRLRVI